MDGTRIRRADRDDWAGFQIIYPGAIGDDPIIACKGGKAKTSRNTRWLEPKHSALWGGCCFFGDVRVSRPYSSIGLIRRGSCKRSQDMKLRRDFCSGKSKSPTDKSIISDKASRFPISAGPVLDVSDDLSCIRYRLGALIRIWSFELVHSGAVFSLLYDARLTRS